jgi:hypothetical protein
MTRTRSVGCYGGHVPDRPDPEREIWVHDAALSLLLDEVIRTVEGLPPDRRPAWWAARADDLHMQAMVSDLYFDLTDGLDAHDHVEFARLLEEAGERLTGAAAELGHALADLIRGTLPEPPTGTLWYFGAPGGRSTIPPV